MNIYAYESAFGDRDVTSRAMRKAVEDWFAAYYDAHTSPNRDPSQRVAYAIVNKLVKTVFGEYLPSVQGSFSLNVLQALDQRKKEAVQLALVGGECYIKPVIQNDQIGFALIPRKNVLIFARDNSGAPTDMGTVERTGVGRLFYTLLERRTVDSQGYLTISNALYRSSDTATLGTRVPLDSHPNYEGLVEKYRYQSPVGSVGLVRVHTPMLNCVDGSNEPVSVYAAAMGLIESINENEAQLTGEFRRGESRLVVSKDMLGERGMQDHLFVGLDEDPDRVGITVFSPALREQSYIKRKQEYLRSIESLVGLMHGSLSDSNLKEKTATEISSSAGDYSLTIIEFQQMWEQALRETLELCICLGRLYGLPGAQQATGLMSVDWGNGVLYDEDGTWEVYRQMVADGLIRPEIALGWRFNMPIETEADLQEIRAKLMPEQTDPTNPA